MSAVEAIAWREWVRFFRQRSRVIGALATPVLFWVLLGFGADRVFSAEGAGVGYREYFFPGALVMILLFTAIFSTITVIEDRKEGFLQSVLIAPVPRFAIVLGKILGCTTLAMINGLLFFALLPIAGVPVTVGSFLSTAGVMFILAMALAGMGYSLAWLMDSTSGYHGIMMLLFMPMLLLSGAFFPEQGAHSVMKVIMAINPLTYGVAALRHTLYGVGPATEGLPAFTLCFGVSVGFALAMLLLGTVMTLRRTARDAQ